MPWQTKCQSLGKVSAEQQQKQRPRTEMFWFVPLSANIWAGFEGGGTSKCTKRLREKTDKSTAEITFRRVVQRSFTILALEDRGHLTYS